MGESNGAVHLAMLLKRNVELTQSTGRPVVDSPVGQFEPFFRQPCMSSSNSPAYQQPTEFKGP